MSGPTVEIVTPAHNEAEYLERCVERLSELAASMPSQVRITVVDSGSTDDTWQVAQTLAERYGITAIRVDLPGRGRAIRAAWSASDADVLAYTDVDLSGDVTALPMMVDLVGSGAADVVIGSRLLEGARVRRRWSRSVMSHTYSQIVQWLAAPPVLDLQCGLKVIDARVAREVLHHVDNEDWFFDTELLLAAWQSGHRLVEVPLEWSERVRTTVRYPSTIVEDLSGLIRLEVQQVGRRLTGGSRNLRVDPAPLGRVAAHEAVQTVAVALICLPGGVGSGAARSGPLRAVVGGVAVAAALRSLTAPGRRGAVPLGDLVQLLAALGWASLVRRVRWLPVLLRFATGSARVASSAVWSVPEPTGRLSPPGSAPHPVGRRVSTRRA